MSRKTNKWNDFVLCVTVAFVKFSRNINRTKANKYRLHKTVDKNSHLWTEIFEASKSGIRS